MHQVRHVAEQIRQTGPTGESNQFPAERFNGHTSANCKSRVAANVNIANNGLLDEHANNLSYTVHLEDPDGDGDMRLAHAPLEDAEDEEAYEGRMAMVRSVTKLLGSARAPDCDANLMDNDTHDHLGYDPQEGSVAVHPRDEVRRPADGRHFFDAGPRRRLTQWKKWPTKGKRKYSDSDLE